MVGGALRRLGDTRARLTQWDELVAVEYSLSEEDSTSLIDAEEHVVAARPDWDVDVGVARGEGVSGRSDIDDKDRREATIGLYDRMRRQLIQEIFSPLSDARVGVIRCGRETNACRLRVERLLAAKKNVTLH